MKITMRLYRLHDLDLMYLYKMQGVSIQKIIRFVLKSYVRDRNNLNGIAQRVEIPRIKHDKPLPQSALIHIYLNEGEDDEVIEWIEQIPKGVRNGMLKNILRGYLDFPMTIPYETNVESSNNISKESENLMKELNQSLKNTKKKRPTKQKETKPDKPVIDVVLDAPLPSTETKTDIVTEQGDKVLNTNKTNEQPNTKQQKIESQPPQKIKEPITEQVTGINEENNDDLFSDFENMMNDF